nr:mechanosensitive ion channel family protein [Shewanella marina]
MAQTAPVTEQITQLSNIIEKDIAQLPMAKGELKALTEYRINQKTDEMRVLIKELMAKPEANKAFLTNLISNQIKFTDQALQYIRQDIKQLQAQLGQKNDNELMIRIANREHQNIDYQQEQLQNIQWADKLGIDTSAEKTALINQLTYRADRLASLLTFSQSQLKAAIVAATEAGKAVTSAQTDKVAQLKVLMTTSSDNLAKTIDLLDVLKQNTAELKQTLFQVSGDITHDVLNFAVASSLIEQWFNVAQKQLVENGPGLMFKTFIFLLILFTASLLSKVAQRIVAKAVSNSKLKFSKLLQDFFISLSGKAVFTIGLLVALSQLGIELGPLLAGFGIAGVIIGFALQDTLSNFASGMMILIYRPYDVGDLINAAGVTGKVSHMSLVSTTIKTLDNQRLIVPNNKIWGDTINNITAEFQRRVDMTFGIGYSDDIEHAEKVLNEIVHNHPKVLKDPEVTVKLHNLGESSVDFVVRPWTKPEDYWDVYWDITREVKMRFDAEGISIPFPQRDVHIYQTKAE